jgi:hypothetical protein
MRNKATITGLLMQQAYESLILAIEAKKKNKVSREVQLSINISLLLGIAVEGVANELSEIVLDTWTYQQLEKATTPLKWRIISSLKVNAFTPNKEPLQTIIKLKRIRDEIAHPKTIKQEHDIIITSKETLKSNPTDDYILPTGDFEVYIGFASLYKKYNAIDSFNTMKKVIAAVKQFKGLFNSKDIFAWVDPYEDLLGKLKLN